MFELLLYIIIKYTLYTKCDKLIDIYKRFFNNYFFIFYFCLRKIVIDTEFPENLL